MNKNIVLATDSYKLNHWNQYPEGIEGVFSYFEARKGAMFPNSVFVGLQYLAKEYLTGVRVTREAIEEAAAITAAHLGSEAHFNRAGWEYILNRFGGKLPVRIKAVPEGTVVPISNALMTVENTGGKETAWLTNHLESLLSHVWYPCTVATLSFYVKAMVRRYLKETSGNDDGLLFKLHDFGYRGVSSHESACVGGAAHLVNFLGTDTVPALMFIRDYYNGKPNCADIAYSVPATEHSVMTALGREGEERVVARLLEKYPTGILSVVSDSYDIYNFVKEIVGGKFKEQILKREGIFVVRPDSVTKQHSTPEDEMVWIMRALYEKVGGTTNSLGYKVINPKVRVLWGDGIDFIGIGRILEAIKKDGFSAENIATFGMGGGLLQKVNRDIQRHAFKCCANKIDGIWYDIFKEPLDASKISKKGRLKLILTPEGYKTVPESEEGENQLVTVFENGELLKDWSFDEIRKRAQG